MSREIPVTATSPVGHTTKEPEGNTVNVAETQNRPEGLAKRLKEIAWRGTGFYVWSRLIIAMFGGDHFVQALNSFLVLHAIAGLASLGFAPVSASHLGVVLKVGWVLVITGFNPLQPVVFVLYLLCFPMLFLFYILFRPSYLEARRTAVQQSAKSGLRPNPSQRPNVAICGSGLLGWYVLFGDAPTTRSIWVAVTLSGALMILLAYRAFRSATPTSDSDATLLAKIERQALQAINNATTLMRKSNEKAPTRLEAHAHRRIYRALRLYFVTLAASMRGKRGRNLISSIIVFYYALSLILLAAAAVLFWAFAIKAISPVGIQFSYCLLASVSHFLPGVSPPVMPSTLPLWTVFGPGITAWVLLGIYVAASTSVLPGRQVAYAQRVQKTYLCLRKCAKSVRSCLRIMDSVLDRATS